MEETDNCAQECSNTNGSFVCTCSTGYMLDVDGRSCKCGGMFYEASGSFSTPGWPIRYPQENFECEWMIDLPDPEATIEFTIDDTAYGINGRAPCPTDYITFLDGMDENAPSLHKLCKFDMPPPFTTTSSQARVVFAGSIKPRRPKSRVGVHVMYNMVMPATVASPNTSTTNSATETPSASVPDATTSETQSPTETVTHENTEATDDTQSPLTTVEPVDTLPPVSSESSPPVGTETPSTSVPDATTSETQSPTETVTHENTEATDDAQPPVTTEALVDTRPPVSTDTSPPVSTETSSPVTTGETHTPVETTEPIDTQEPDSLTTLPVAPIVTTNLPVSIDECATNNGGCEQLCVDTPESYYCECESGYELDSDEHTCNVVCGGILTERTGSFQTPGWPNGYPQKDFVCEWRVTQPVRRLIWFGIDGNFGIDGEAPCTTDYLQFFNGADQTNPEGDKFCSARPRSSNLFVTNTDATVVFRGTTNSNRPIDRIGVKVTYMTLLAF